MRVFLLWESSPAGEEAFLAGTGGGDVCVAFDPLGRSHESRGAPVIKADDLLEWPQRVAIEAEVGNLIERVSNDQELAGIDVEGHSVVEALAYKLRYEWTNALCAFHAVRTLAEGRSIDRLVAQPGCPSSVAAGAAAAVADTCAAPQPTPHGWIPVYPRPSHRGLRGKAGSAAVRAGGSRPSRRDIRIVAFANMKVIPALMSLTPAQLRAAGVGVAPYPDVAIGGVARLALRRRLPIIRVGKSRIQPDLGDLVLSQPLHDSPALDAALKSMCRVALSDSAGEVARGAATARALDGVDECRAIILPTSIVGSARVLQTWARQRGVTCAVIQHGMYVLREEHGGDRFTDVLFTWGEGIAKHAAAWGEPRPRLIAVGAPGISANGHRPVESGRIRRVLVGTTGSPVITALAQYAFCESFMAAIASGLRQLQREGARVTLRLHPAESEERYRPLLDRLELSLEFDRSASLGEAIAEADMVVSSMSSVAFEAAAAGVPTVLWSGHVPDRVRRTGFLPPWSDDLPASFRNSTEFERLADEAIQRPDGFRAEAAALRDQIGAYAGPFEPQRFADELLRLAR